MDYISNIILTLITIVSVFTDFDQISSKYKLILRVVIIVVTVISLGISMYMIYTGNQEKEVTELLNKDLHNKLQRSNNKIDSLKHNLGLAQQRLKAMSDDLKKLQKQLQNTADELSQSSDANARRLGGEIGKTISSISDVQKDATALGDNLVQMNASIGNLRNELDKAQENISNVLEENQEILSNSLIEVAEGIKEGQKKTDEKIEKIDATNKELMQKLAEIEKKFEGMLSKEDMEKLLEQIKTKKDTVVIQNQ
ncbi:MAG: hypothetical protein EAZ55_03470 [Cytophagales bacterium]|nr:MAG: hypothetical protein EAZ55_03470 [Cytophagales bacterium]